MSDAEKDQTEIEYDLRTRLASALAQRDSWIELYDVANQKVKELMEERKKWCKSWPNCACICHGEMKDYQ